MEGAAEMVGGYRLQNLLQTGQSSQVYEVVEMASMRHFAMKILLPERAKDPEQRRALFYEAEVGKKLAHPNVIKILTVNRDPNLPYFIMEFFPSGSLRTKMQLKQFDFLKQNCEKIRPMWSCPSPSGSCSAIYASFIAKRRLRARRWSHWPAPPNSLPTACASRQCATRPVNPRCLRSWMRRTH